MSELALNETETTLKAKALGIEIKPDWSEQYLKRLVTMEENKQTATVEVVAGPVEKPTPAPKPVAKDADLFRVELRRNYMPMSDNYNIVSEPDPEENGRVPGVGQAGRLWAGTVVDLPKPEASRLLGNKINVRETYMDGEGKNKTRVVVRADPLAERFDAFVL